MDWRYKAILQTVFSALPQGERFNHLFQRHITRSDRLDEARFRDIVSWATSHIQAIRAYQPRPLEQLHFYEFGAGYHLIGPLTFFAYGIERQTIIDINVLMRPKLVNDTISKFRTIDLGLDLPRLPVRPVSDAHLLESLRELYGIDYRAPCDACDTGLPSSSVDCITSTSTLEHISPIEIKAILRECHRILRLDGIVSLSIDYADHYSFFDKSISEYNFLRYSDSVWKIFSPRLHFQNRLRHPDYVRLIESNQFEIVEERRREGSSADLDTVRRIPIAKRFTEYRFEDLAARGAYFLLRKRLM